MSFRHFKYFHIPLFSFILSFTSSPWQISLGIPDEPARARILQVLTRKLTLSGDFDFCTIARLTPGFVGADLSALTKVTSSVPEEQIPLTLPDTFDQEASIIAIRRIFGELEHQLEAELATNPGGSSPVSAPSTPSTASVSSAGPPAAANTAANTAMAAEAELERRISLSNRLRARKEPLSEEFLSNISIQMNDFMQAIKKVAAPVFEILGRIHFKRERERDRTQCVVSVDRR